MIPRWRRDSSQDVCSRSTDNVRRKNASEIESSVRNRGFPLSLPPIGLNLLRANECPQEGDASRTGRSWLLGNLKAFRSLVNAHCNSKAPTVPCCCASTRNRPRLLLACPRGEVSIPNRLQPERRGRPSIRFWISGAYCLVRFGERPGHFP